MNTREKRKKVRRALVLAAREAFRKKGFTKTTMDDIARAAGKAKSTLYYYFDSKEAAFQAVVHLEGETLKNRLLKVIRDPHRNPKQKLEDYVLIRWQGFEALGNAFQTMRQEFLQKSHLVEKYRKQYDELEMELIGTILREGIQKKTFRIAPEAVETVSLTIVLGMKALEIPFFASGQYSHTDSKIKNLLDMLFFGIVQTE